MRERWTRGFKFAGSKVIFDNGSVTFYAISIILVMSWMVTYRCRAASDFFQGGEGAESASLLAMIERGILLSFFGHMRLLDNTS